MDETLRIARRFSASVMFDAIGSGNLSDSIAPLERKSVLHGFAFTVRTGGESNYWIREAIRVAGPDDVLVIETGCPPSRAFIGNLISTAAKARGLRGIVIDNRVRDSDEIIRLGLPCFCLGRTLVPASRSEPLEGGLCTEIHIGDTVVHRGDLIIGDVDGVVAVPRESVAGTLKKAASILRAEKSSLRRN